MILTAGLFAVAAAAVAGGRGERIGANAAPISITGPRARTAVAGGNGAAYFLLTNRGDTADALLEARAEVARTVELHTHTMEGGMMRMRQVDLVDVPAAGSVEFRPGGFHVMLLGLTGALAEGDEFPLTLVFREAGEIVVTVRVTSTP